MNLLQEALRYLNDPFNWTRTGGILELLGEHLRISALAVLAAMVVAIPVGVLLGHTGRGGGFTVALSNVSRAVPTLDHFLAGQIMPDAYDIDAAGESMREVYEIADLIVPGHDNVFANPRHAGM